MIARRTGQLATLVIALVVLGGCEGYRVTRLYDGRSRAERFIGDLAYGAFTHGAELEAQGDDAGAIAAYRVVLEEDPESFEAWTRIGAIRCRSGEPAEAAAAFEKSEQLDANYSGLWRARAECGEGRKAPDEAAAARAFALDPDSDDAALLYVRALAHQGKTGQALALLTELSVRSPSSAPVWQALADYAAAHESPAWRARAERKLAAIDAARRPEHRPELDDLVRALARRDVAAAKAIAVALRLEPHALAALAITAGAPRLALDESLRRLAADPADTDARLLAALAADLVSPTDQRASELLAVPPGDPPSEVGRLALAELLARHLGIAADLWSATPAAPSDVPAEVIERLRAHVRDASGQTR